MQLHKVRRGSRIRINADWAEGENSHPPAHREFKPDEELEFYHIDGMYSYCKDDDGNVVHLVAWAEVEVLRDGMPTEPTTPDQGDHKDES